jgi:protein phosphatase
MNNKFTIPRHTEDQSSSSKLPLSAAYVSDIGYGRENNEDSCGMDLERGMFILSDGMGGHEAGEVASQLIVSALPRLLKKVTDPSAIPYNKLESILRESTSRISQELHKRSTSVLGIKGAGATLAMIWVLDQTGTVAVVTMGDSPVFRLRGEKLERLTIDHTITSLLVEVGELTPEEALTHHARSKLTRYIGMEGEVYPDVQRIQLKGGDRLLLCSDGLVDMVSHHDVFTHLDKEISPLKSCQALVRSALLAGGEDNITVMVVDWKRSWRERGEVL